LLRILLLRGCFEDSFFSSNNSRLYHDNVLLNLDMVVAIAILHMKLCNGALNLRLSAKRPSSLEARQ